MPGHKTVLCAASDWSVGSTSGTDIDGCIVSVVRFSRIFAQYYSGKIGTSPTFPRKLRYGELNKTRIQKDDASRLKMDQELALRGYLVPYRKRSFWTRQEWEAHYDGRFRPGKK